MNEERCTWVTSPVTGAHYGSCGADVDAIIVDKTGKRRRNKGASELPEEMELCPNCGKLVEVATWEEVQQAL